VDKNKSILRGNIKLSYIPKPLEDADSEVSPDARTRRNMMRMVIPFSNVTTQY